MELIYPNKKEIMEFFSERGGFIKVQRIAELLVTPMRPNLQNEEITHIKGLLHKLKADGFLLIENEGQDIYHEGFSSTPDRIAKYFDQSEAQDRSTNQRGKAVKQRYKDKDLFIELRSQGDDEHLLIGKRDGTANKAHVIIDKEDALIRLEDGRRDPTEIVPRIETIVTLPNGRKIKLTREVVEEFSYLPKIEIEKVSFKKIVTLAEGLVESFIVKVPILIKNLSSEKIMIRNIKPVLELPDGYRQDNFYSSIKLAEDQTIAGKDFLFCQFNFAANIQGREKGIDEQNTEYVANKNKILTEISTKKIVFRISMEVVSLEGTTAIEETSDLTDTLLPQIKILKKGPIEGI